LFFYEVVSGRVAAQLWREGKGEGRRQQRDEFIMQHASRRSALASQAKSTFLGLIREREKARARERERERETVAPPVTAGEFRTKTKLEKRGTTVRNEKLGPQLVNAGPRAFRGRGSGGSKAGARGFRVYRDNSLIRDRPRPRTTIRPQEYAYCRVLGGEDFL